MLEEWGVELDHTTVYRWVQHYAPELEKRLKWFTKSGFHLSWRVDETYVKVKGEWIFLYRAVDKDGNTIDFFLSTTQDKHAAKSFFKKSLKKPENPKPEKVNTDKHLAYPVAIEDLKEEGVLPKTLKHRRSKYLNNGIESDHARFKQPLKPMRGFNPLSVPKIPSPGWKPWACSKKDNLPGWKTTKPRSISFTHSLAQLLNQQ